MVKFWNVIYSLSISAETLCVVFLL